jgi:hypothetical protein
MCSILAKSLTYKPTMTHKKHMPIICVNGIHREKSMYTLSYISPYTFYKAGEYESVEACEQDCETRYHVKGLKFKQTDDGTWRAVVAAEEGAITLRLVYQGEQE